jgi:SpoU rRNA methylase family enzyme
MQEVLEGARGLRAEASERVVTRDEVERVLLVVEGKTKGVEKVEGALRGVRRVAEEERKAREVEAKKWRYAEMLKTTRQKQIDAKMSDQVNSLYQAVNSSLNNFV